MKVKLSAEGFKRACGIVAAGFAVLLSGAPLSLAIAGTTAPGPLIGFTGPYGILAAGIGYGGYLLFKRFKNPRE